MAYSGVGLGPKETSSTMRWMTFGWLVAFQTSDASAAEVSVGVALGGALTLGSAGEDDVSGAIGGGSLTAPIRVHAADGRAALRLAPRVDYLQGYRHVVQLPGSQTAPATPSTTLTSVPPLVDARIPTSSLVFGGSVGAEAALLRREKTSVYLLADAGLGGSLLGAALWGVPEIAEEVNRCAVDNSCEEATKSEHHKMKPHLVTMASLGLGAALGPMRAELTYGRWALGKGEWTNSPSPLEEVPAEALSTLQLSVGATFGG